MVHTPAAMRVLVPMAGRADGPASRPNEGHLELLLVVLLATGVLLLALWGALRVTGRRWGSRPPPLPRPLPPDPEP